MDERDTMFARMARVPGTVAYEAYYHARPRLKAADDRLRRLPPLLEPGGRYYDATICGEARRHFEAIDRIAVADDDIARWRAALARASEPPAALRRMALALGAVAAGCATVDPSHVYTHKGRFDADFGRVIGTDLGFALVFLVEMDFDAMRAAPRAPVICESARQYYRGAVVARTVEAVLTAVGHRARAHYDAHYEVILPPLAVAAGLGELGRHNILVADRFGSRVRIGAVTTDLPLAATGPARLGVDRFCQGCRKCAENCPSRALSSGPKEEVRGTWKWPTDVERCYGYWRAAGTDCGICMAVCPFSHRDTWFHAAVRRTVRHAPWIAPFARWCDDRLYGRRWRGTRRD